MHRIIAAAAIAAVFLGAATHAAERAKRWEGTLQLIGNRGQTSNGEMGSSLDVDSEVGFAFSLGYNFHQNFALNFDASFIKPDYTAVFNTDEDGLVAIDHTMNVFNGQLNGVWNMLEGPFTPYLQAGFGWTHVDSNVADGPPTTGCWWDPWWGYVCSNFYSTYSDTNFSYGAGAGLRYQLQNRVFFKGSVNRTWIDNSADGADPTFDLWRLEIGRVF